MNDELISDEYGVWRAVKEIDPMNFGATYRETTIHTVLAGRIDEFSRKFHLLLEEPAVGSVVFTADGSRWVRTASEPWNEEAWIDTTGTHQSTPSWKALLELPGCRIVFDADAATRATQ